MALVHSTRVSRWGRSLRALFVAVLMGGLAAVAPLAVSPAGASSLRSIVNNVGGVVDVAVDGAGNVYASTYTGVVEVQPAATGTLFGQPVTAGVLTTLATLDNVAGLALDGAGNLYMTDQTEGTISVLASSPTTLFGVTVPADTVTTLASGLDAPVGVAFDSAGNLYAATQNGVSVLPAASGTLFGQPVTIDTLTALSSISGLGKGGFVAFDGSGNLYVSDVDNGTVSVLPVASGSVFGTPVTADTLTTLLSGLGEAAGLAFDPSGDLYVDYYGTIGVLPVSSGTLLGTAVTADTLTTLGTGLLGDLGSTFTSGALDIADQGNQSVDQLGTPTATISSVSFDGTASNPVVVVTGTGFDPSPPPTTAGCSASGSDYSFGDLYLLDISNSWGAGLPGDCIGLNAAVLSSTEAVFGLGDFYSGYAVLSPGDSYTVGVDGATFSGTVAYGGSISSAAVTSVVPATGPGGGGGTVTIHGTGLVPVQAVMFGSVPAATFTLGIYHTTITAPAPAETAGTVDVTLVTPGAVSATGAGDQYTYLPPTITSLSKTAGPGEGGTKIAIDGADLQGASFVQFGGIDAESYTVAANGKSITAYTPPSTAGTVDVTVATPGGTVDDPGAFTFDAPVVTLMSPASGGIAGGTKVVIHGAALQGSTVLFGGQAPESDSINAGGTAITAYTPSVVDPGAVDVSVSTPGGAADAGNFTYLATTITSVSPALGGTAGGTKVTIHGVALSGATAVQFGGMDAESYTINAGGTAITAYTPSLPAGAVDVSVAAPSGSPDDPGAFTFEGPTITHVDPSMGYVVTENEVVIEGKYLIGATAVQFGGIDASSYTINATGTLITAYTPESVVTGTVDVTVATPNGGFADKANSYTYTGYP